MSVGMKPRAHQQPTSNAMIALLTLLHTITFWTAWFER
jgi:hypothetical protein